MNYSFNLLKNQHKYTVLRFTEFLLGSAVNLFSILIPKKNVIIITSSHNNSFNFNSKYFFEYLIQEEYENLYYLISSGNKRQTLEKEYGKRFISRKKLSEIFIIISAKTWISSTLETPFIGLFAGVNRQVINLGHGAMFKGVGLSEKKVSYLKRIYYSIIIRNFTFFCATSESQIKLIQNTYGCPAKKVIVTGQPRNDHFYLNEQRSGIKRVLLAPTWRKNKHVKWSEILSTNLNLYLQENSIELYFRLHPFYERKVNIESMSNIKSLNSSLCEEISDFLPSVDLLITDYSSIYIDFLLFRRPILFLKVLHEDFMQSTGCQIDYEYFTPGFKVTNDLEIIEKLKLLKETTNPLPSNYKKVHDSFYLHKSGSSSKRILEILKISR